MRSGQNKLESLRKLRDKSGSSFYEFSTSWWALLFFLFIVGGCVFWNSFTPWAFDPYPYNGLRTVLALLGAIQTPILLLYSRKSTDYRKKLLEKDYELEVKIFKKIEVIENEMKQDREIFLKEIKRLYKINKHIRRKIPTEQSYQLGAKTERHDVLEKHREILQVHTNKDRKEKSKNISA